jgi:hypothetical protein
MLFYLIITNIVLIMIPTAAIIISKIMPWSCNEYYNKENAQVFLFAMSVGNLMVELLNGIFFVGMFFGVKYLEKKFELFILILWLGMVILIFIYSADWIILGSLILFKANKKCIDMKNFEVIYSVVSWIVAIFQMMVQICLYKIYINILMSRTEELCNKSIKSNDLL